jgi:hypothetical protein
MLLATPLCYELNLYAANARCAAAGAATNYTSMLLTTPLCYELNLGAGGARCSAAR